MTDVVAGPLWRGRNWAAHAGEGSIHDDDTAADLGFRGGTVPGDVHMNQFPATLLKIFGDTWWETGHLSLNFKNATVDREAVQVFVEPGDDGLARVWMERDDGLLICEGTAGLDNLTQAHLHTRDMRPCDPAELRILQKVSAGLVLGDYEMHTAPGKQFDRYDQGLLSDPLEWFRRPHPRFDAVLACPATFIQFMWGPPMDGLRPYTADAVGLFGAIEIAQRAGPFLLDRTYRFVSKVLSVGQSPKTEYLWYETIASEGDKEIASMRMQLRFMKASSDLYTQTNEETQ